MASINLTSVPCGQKSCFESLAGQHTLDLSKGSANRIRRGSLPRTLELGRSGDIVSNCAELPLLKVGVTFFLNMVGAPQEAAAYAEKSLHPPCSTIGSAMTKNWMQSNAFQF